MGKESTIQWTTHTFNPWRGCTKVSKGCANCYAEALSKRNPAVLGIWGDNGKRVIGSDAYWRQPLAWEKAAAAAGERHRVFCASLADVFEDRPELDAPRARLLALIAATPHLDWLLLTKRPQLIRSLLERAAAVASPHHRLDDFVAWWLGGDAPANIWLGTSVEDQETAGARIPHLLQIPAAVRFLSMEPLLERVDLQNYLKAPWMPDEIVRPDSVPVEYMPVIGVDWVIIGGESSQGGAQARPFNLEWARSLRDQCRAAGVPVFIKQLGSRPFIDTTGGSRYDDHTYHKLHDHHGGEWEHWPADLRVREVPTLA